MTLSTVISMYEWAPLLRDYTTVRALHEREDPRGLT